MFNPKYTISPSLLVSIKRITILVHELNKRQLPQAVQMALQTEARAVSAFASTSIEGNPLPLTEVKRILKNRPQQAHQNEQEVLNYNQVLQEMSAAPPSFTKRLLLQIHRGVMKGLLPKHQIGRFRQEPVVVYNSQTGEIVYLPPDHSQIEPLVNDLIHFVQTNQSLLDPLLLAGIFHKQLVIIHPFVDGNGRTIRLAANLLLARVGLKTANLFSFENYYNQNVTRYFQQVGLFGNYYDLIHDLDFTPWLEYFAEGVLDELLRAEKIFTTAQATPYTTLQPYHQQILGHIDQHGFITDKEYAQLTDRAKATRSLDFKKLLELGVIERKGSGKNTFYQRKA